MLVQLVPELIQGILHHGDEKVSLHQEIMWNRGLGGGSQSDRLAEHRDCDCGPFSELCHPHSQPLSSGKQNHVGPNA